MNKESSRKRKEKTMHGSREAQPEVKHHRVMKVFPGTVCKQWQQLHTLCAIKGYITSVYQVQLSTAAQL